MNPTTVLGAIAQDEQKSVFQEENFAESAVNDQPPCNVTAKPTGDEIDSTITSTGSFDRGSEGGPVVEAAQPPSEFISKVRDGSQSGPSAEFDETQHVTCSDTKPKRSRKAWALSLLARVNCFQKKQKSRRAQSADSSEASDYDFDVLKCLEGEYIRFDSFDSPEMLRMCSSTGEGSGNFLTSTGNFAAYEQLTTGESGFPSSSEVAANSSEQDGASDPWPRAELMALNDVGGENNRQFSNPPTGSDDSVVGSNQKSDESCVSNQTHGGKIDDEGQGLGHDASGSSPQAVNTIASSESSGSFPCNDTMQEVSDSDNSSSIDETEIVCMARESKLARPGLEGLALKKIVTRNRPMFEELFAEKPDSKCNVGQGQAQAFADNAECGTRCLGDVREPSRFKAAIDTILEWIFCGMIAAK